jgi:hypothetical protein
MSESVTSHVRRGGGLLAVVLLVVTAALWLVPGIARAADAATDSDCATQPSDVPAGYSCTVIYEPNGSSNGTYGELWFSRDTSNVLHLLAYTTLNADPDVLLCARTSGPYTPSNDNQSDKCIGNTDSLIYQGPLSALGQGGGQSLDGVAPLSQTVYWVLHLNQSGKTTVGLATSAGLVAQPTASFTDSCDSGGIVVDLGNANGTAPAHFTLTYGGADHVVDVPAGGSTQQLVSVAEDTSGSVTVAAPGLANSPVTHSWARDCTHPEVQPAAAPTAAFDHGCDLGGIRVTLGNTAGTAPVDFTVHYDGADHTYPLAAGASTAFTVPVAEDTTGTVTVTAPGLAATSDTWARDCTATVSPEQHAVNPEVSFSTACTTGITAVLSNMKLDDTTTDPVTFTITTPTGAVEQVVVAANHISKRSYPVTEDTTGVVTVEAPGLAKQTESYAKDCATVLGEKVTQGGKTPNTPSVQGDKAAQLPMTGIPASSAVKAALLMLAVGTGMVLTGRRRRRVGAHVRR